MNVMAKAHKATKAFFKNVPSSKMTYAAIFKENLVTAHGEYKAECEASPVIWYSITGHVICPDTNTYIPVGEGTSNVEKAANSVLWYVQNFEKHCIQMTYSRQNGSVFVERPNTNYK